MSYPIMIPPLPVTGDVTVILGDGEQTFPQGVPIDLSNYYPINMPTGTRIPVPTVGDPSTEVEWIRLVNVTDSDGALEKTSGGTGWNARGVFIIPTLGDFSIEFKIDGGNTYAGIGFLDPSTSYSDINYGFGYDTTTYYFYSCGFNTATHGGRVAGDVLKVAREASEVNFYVNDVLVHTDAFLWTDPFASGYMLFDCSLYTEGSTISDIVLTYY